MTTKELNLQDYTYKSDILDNLTAKSSLCNDEMFEISSALEQGDTADQIPWDNVFGSYRPVDGADITADNNNWSDVVDDDTHKPADNADVTSANNNWSDVVDDDTHKPADNATENTGALADKDAVDLATAEVTNKIADNITAARNYDAIVASSGGDYTTIQAAIAANKSRLFVRAGTYTISADIVLTDEISIIGENYGLTILDFDNNDVEMKAVTNSTYSTGTISISNDSKIITGSGTTWDGNVTAGDWIKLGNYLYEIDSIDTDTQITLLKDYKGVALSGDAYVAATFLKNITIKNLSFKNLGSGSSGSINFQYVKSSLIKDCKILGNANSAIYFQNVYNTIIRDNNLSHCNQSINGQGGNYFNIISGNNINNNDQSCILLSATDKYNKIINNELNNSDDGIRLAGDYNIASQNHICYNHLHGIELSGDYNIIAGNQINNNTAQITDTGTDNIVDNNFE